MVLNIVLALKKAKHLEETLWDLSKKKQFEHLLQKHNELQNIITGVNQNINYLYKENATLKGAQISGLEELFHNLESVINLLQQQSQMLTELDKKSTSKVDSVLNLGKEANENVAKISRVLIDAINNFQAQIPHLLEHSALPGLLSYNKYEPVDFTQSLVKKVVLNTNRDYFTLDFIKHCAHYFPPEWLSNGVFRHLTFCFDMKHEFYLSGEMKDNKVGTAKGLVDYILGLKSYPKLLSLIPEEHMSKNMNLGEYQKKKILFVMVGANTYSAEDFKIIINSFSIDPKSLRGVILAAAFGGRNEKATKKTYDILVKSGLIQPPLTVDDIADAEYPQYDVNKALHGGYLRVFASFVKAGIDFDFATIKEWRSAFWPYYNGSVQEICNELYHFVGKVKIPVNAICYNAEKGQRGAVISYCIDKELVNLNEIHSELENGVTNQNMNQSVREMIQGVIPSIKEGKISYKDFSDELIRRVCFQLAENHDFSLLRKITHEKGLDEREFYAIR